MQTSYKEQAFSSKLGFYRNTQGLSAPFQRQMEATILSQYQRLPGLHSEFLGLDVVTGADEDFGFEDVLNNPRDSVRPPQPLHDVMERKLGLVHSQTASRPTGF
eukprot:JP446923.1.p1 GENE.JP446923.1~~JP446923.1.p1  ORF type:complete len:104 (-),score=21.83 JP446923.1:335-646(-)